MFTKIKIRYFLTLIWIITFIGMWSIFAITLPYNVMENQLDKIQENIEENDWKMANEYIDQFYKTYTEKHYLIKMNNSTEALITFEHTIGQLILSAKHNSENTIEYVGALREMLKLVVRPFSGP